MWKDSIRNNVVIFQPNILRIVGFYVRHSAIIGFLGQRKFSNLSVLHKGLLMQDWVFRLGFSTNSICLLIYQRIASI